MGIYFDNAATTLKKPDCVINAVTEALKNLGNSSRGAYEASMDASRLIYDTRVQLAALFHAGEPRQTAFTSNSTEALNTAILGLLQGSGHVITTVIEHNSVLRPLYRLETMGTELSFLSCGERGELHCEGLEAALRRDTGAVVCTHASILTGNSVDL